MKFRRAVVADARMLADFAAAAFRDTYQELDDANDIAAYVAEHFSLQTISECLRDPLLITLLAEVNLELAGYAQIRRAAAPACVEGPAPLELARLYLGRKFVGQGYGGQLMRAIHAEARRLGGQTLWLGVYDRNVRAVRFYEQFGFAKVGGKEFLFGGRVYIDPIYSAPVRNDV